MGHDRTSVLPVWRLRFEDHPGLEVRVTVPTLQAQALAPALVPLFLSGRQRDVVAAVVRMAGPFADSLLSWTVEWAGRPVPCTRSGLRRVDLGLLLLVLQEWIALWPAPVAESEEQVVDEPEEDPERDLLASLPMTALALQDVSVPELVAAG